METPTNEIKLLIVEDNVAESINAQTEAFSLGFREVSTATNLSEAQRYLPQVQAVASDLFFPAGEVSTDQYVQRFSLIYEAFKKRRFTPIEKDNIVLRALEHNAEIFGVTPKRYVEEIMVNLNSPQSLIKDARDAIAGINDSEKYEQFLKIEQDVRAGKNLPLGIIVAEQATASGLECVIVTSTHHHDLAFEPIKNLLRGPYVDILRGDQKRWDLGFAQLVSGGIK